MQSRIPCLFKTAHFCIMNFIHPQTPQISLLPTTLSRPNPIINQFQKLSQTMKPSTPPLRLLGSPNIIDRSIPWLLFQINFQAPLVAVRLSQDPYSLMHTRQKKKKKFPFKKSDITFSHKVIPLVFPQQPRAPKLLARIPKEWINHPKNYDTTTPFKSFRPDRNMTKGEDWCI